jgi:hypothetical protein
MDAVAAISKQKGRGTAADLIAEEQDMYITFVTHNPHFSYIVIKQDASSDVQHAQHQKQHAKPQHRYMFNMNLIFYHQPSCRPS